MNIVPPSFTNTAPPSFTNAAPPSFTNAAHPSLPTLPHPSLPNQSHVEGYNLQANTQWMIGVLSFYNDIVFLASLQSNIN